MILKLHGASTAPDSTGQLRDHRGQTTSTTCRGRHRRADPVHARERMADSHFLFLGYCMRDWNLRVILNRIWGAQELDLKSWAVQREPRRPSAKTIEETLWRAGRRRPTLRAAAGVRGGARSGNRSDGAGRTPAAVERRRAAAASLPATPYVGLVPYTEDDASFFFGRDAEHSIVTANLRGRRLTLLDGPSAGLVPASRGRPRPSRTQHAREADSAFRATRDHEGRGPRPACREPRFPDPSSA